MVNTDKLTEFKSSKGETFLIRCPQCERENYLPNVAAGICAWCGYDANRKESNGEKTPTNPSSDT